MSLNCPGREPFDSINELRRRGLMFMLIASAQRRNSAFFLDEKKQSIFFLKMVDTNLMNKYQKKKK